MTTNMGDYQPDSALSAPAQEPRQDQQPQVEQKGQPQDEREAPRWVWFLIGPTGCGKTTHAKALAKNLNFTYIEGDNYHPPASVEKMKAGQPLTDDDRAGWLQKLQALETAEPAAGESPHKVMTCSALKRQYRDVLRGAGADTERKNLRVRFVFFEGSEETLTERTERRKGHFAKENLVSSQFEVLERPTSGEEDVVTVSCEGWRQQTEELMMAAVRDVMRKEGWVFEEEEEEEGEEEEEEDKVPPSTSVSSTV